MLVNNRKLVLFKFINNLLMLGHFSILCNSWLILFCKDRTSLCDSVKTLSSAYNVTSKLEHSAKSFI